MHRVLYTTPMFWASIRRLLPSGLVCSIRLLFRATTIAKRALIWKIRHFLGSRPYPHYHTTTPRHHDTMTPQHHNTTPAPTEHCGLRMVAATDAQRRVNDTFYWNYKFVDCLFRYSQPPYQPPIQPPYQPLNQSPYQPRSLWYRSVRIRVIGG